MRSRPLPNVTREPDPVFLLIPSPLVGPKTWSRVAHELERRGRERVVPSLLGVADAEAPQWRRVSETVRAATAWTPNPIVLVGHSGGGLLLPAITGALMAEVAGVVFATRSHRPRPGTCRWRRPHSWTSWARSPPMVCCRRGRAGSMRMQCERSSPTSACARIWRTKCRACRSPTSMRACRSRTAGTNFPAPTSCSPVSPTGRARPTPVTAAGR